jgi:hypothetical protein
LKPVSDREAEIEIEKVADSLSAGNGGGDNFFLYLCHYLCPGVPILERGLKPSSDRERR